MNIGQKAPILPTVQCGHCRFFKPNRNNPAQGIGTCIEGLEGMTAPWPHANRSCDGWEPTEAAVAVFCEQATQGTRLDPKPLAEWLIAQNDPFWMTPDAIAWWVAHITKNGYPKDPEKKLEPIDYVAPSRRESVQISDIDESIRDLFSSEF